MPTDWSVKAREVCGCERCVGYGHGDDFVPPDPRVGCGTRSRAATALAEAEAEGVRRERERANATPSIGYKGSPCEDCNTPLECVRCSTDAALAEVLRRVKEGEPCRHIADIAKLDECARCGEPMPDPRTTNTTEGEP